MRGRDLYDQKRVRSLPALSLRAMSKIYRHRHASNLFTRPENIRWLSGEDLLQRFDVQGRRISNVFCQQCGSRMPWLGLSGDVLAVPAGCLDGTPAISPTANIFWPERAEWYDQAVQAERYDEFFQ